MAVKYIELEQAAKMLGVSTDELNNMRLSGEIYGVRDGSSWKFKSDEIDRVAEERGISLGGDSDAEADFDLDLGAAGGGSVLGSAPGSGSGRQTTIRPRRLARRADAGRSQCRGGQRSAIGGIRQRRLPLPRAPANPPRSLLPPAIWDSIWIPSPIFGW